MRYDTVQKQIAFIKTAGNIVTFKERQFPYGPNGRSYPQTIVKHLIALPDGRVKLVGMFWETEYYNNEAALLQVIDWEDMERMHEDQEIKNS